MAMKPNYRHERQTRERAKDLKLDDAQEREAVLKYHRQARDFWQNAQQIRVISAL